MIQSGKFDSSNMDIKKLANSVLIFVIRRLIEISGIFVLCLGVLLLIALISYIKHLMSFLGCLLC